jgi:hypothetical protein
MCCGPGSGPVLRLAQPGGHVVVVAAAVGFYYFEILKGNKN